jgi:hypothetical protein
MSKPTPGPACVICGEGEQQQKPLVPPAFEGEAVMCLGCLNSPAGIAWRRARRTANPLYDRYCTLTTISLPSECPHCRRPLYVSAKARGMASARWDVVCLRCHRRRPEPMYAFGATEPAFDALQRVEQDFIRGRGLDDIDRRVAGLRRRTITSSTRSSVRAAAGSRSRRSRDALDVTPSPSTRTFTTWTSATSRRGRPDDDGDPACPRQ